MPLGRVNTPALMVDIDVFDANVAAMNTLLSQTSKALRPHIKTHRTPALALRQVGGPTRGVTCSTVGEAEVMVDAGITDVLVANEVVDPGKIQRLVRLVDRADVTIAVDSARGVELLSTEARRQGATVKVLVDLDILIHRCGVSTPAEALTLARLVAASPGLDLDGIMGYEGRIRADVADRGARISAAYALLRDVAQTLRDDGLPIRTVSGSGTSTVIEALADPVFTELQAGVYAVMEPELTRMGLPFTCATAVRGTVISLHHDRVVLDIGRRSVGMEYGPPIPIGFSVHKVSVSDEHTILWTDGDAHLLGSQVDMIPSQVRTTFNLHEEVMAVSGGEIVATWPITARGSSR
jgi:D-serine deaminase-like pyridoxal phosphate-dependent protein